MRIHRFEAVATCARFNWIALVATILAMLCAANAIAQAPIAAGVGAPASSAQELDQLVGPIALYPDDLVAIVLPAATNPLQLVQADRFLEKRKADPKLAVDEKWDDAVKSLLNYPDVVTLMSRDLDWTTALGAAVVDDQSAVLDAIQGFRRKAQSAGNLKTDDKQVVVVEKEVVTIVPADPQVIYVPQYNPSTVVAYSSTPVYGYWPSAYPSYYYPYPPGAALATGIIWGAAIGAAWNGGRYGTNWGGNNDITINRDTNINTGNVNRAGQAGTRPANTTAWKSDKQSGQVGGTGTRSSSAARVGDARTGNGVGGASAGATRASASASNVAGGAGNAAAARNSPGSFSASPRDQYGGRSSSGGGDAFGGYGSGRQAQMDSSRGAASRGSMSGGGARPMPTGGGGAGRGGGGGGRGGGGRGR